MWNFVQKNLLILVIAFAAGAAWLLPAPGIALPKAGLVSPYIFIIFLCQGAAIDARRFREAGHYARLLAWGFTVAFLLAPLLGWLMMNALAWQGDFRVGFLLMCCMGPTLVSGIIVSTQAGGEAEGAALLTIVLNLVAVLMIPLALGWTLGSGSTFDQTALLKKLLVLVLLPAVVGQSLRLLRPGNIETTKHWLKNLPVLLLGLIIYISMAEQNDNLQAMDFNRLLAVIPPALAVHYALLLVGYGTADKILKAGARRATSLAFVCSQKTLPVAVAVWATELATPYPLAILPPIIFHMSQIAGDGVLAAWWAKRVATKKA